MSERPLRAGALLVLLLLPVLFIPTSLTGFDLVWTASNQFLSTATFAALFAIVAYSLAMVMRFAGLPSVVHAALWGAGAYTAGSLADRLDWPFLALLPFAVLVPMGLALLVGFPALKTTGMSFLIITIAFNEFLVLIANNWTSVTKGTAGLIVAERPSIPGPVNFAESRVGRYYLVLGCVYLTIALVWAISRSTFGRRLEAIRDNEHLAQSLGINSAAHKTAIFVLSAGVAGLAGQLLVYHQQAVTPGLFNAIPFITVFLMVVLGGQRSLAGPAVGAWVVLFLPEWFEPLGLTDDNRQTLVFGLLLMVFMIAAPLGVAGLGHRGARRLRERLAQSSDATSPAPPRTLAAAPAPAGTAELAPGIDGTAATTLGQPILAVEDLRMHFGALEALGGIDLEVREGEILGIIGPNGSGKTTLFNCVSGFLVPTRGRIVWRDVDVSGWRPDRISRAGLVRTFQQPMLFASMSVRRSCELALERARRDGRRARLGLPSDPDELLEFVGLHEAADMPVTALPYGYMRTLGVAVALSTGPELLVLDEPAAGLNEAECAELQWLLRRIRAAGVTISVIDHDMPFLMPLSDRIVVLDSGVKIAEGTPSAVQGDRRVVASYLGERFSARAVSQ